MRRLTRAVPAVLLLVSLAALFSARGGDTVPLYAARTGLLCQNCHFDPNGGGPRNEFGFNFAKNRHSLMPDTSGAWKDLSLVNRVGDSFPLYVGLNQRFMLIANTTVKSDSLDRSGFFDMENAFYLTFQPHSRLSLVYSRDGFDAGSTTKDAFGMISGFPMNGYLKAGRFRNPFGLRLDDHTVATRQGFLDFFVPSAPFNYQASLDSLRTSYLPYDPRQPDMGLEYGVEWNGVFARAAWTDGESHPLFGPSFYAGAKALKVGYNNSWYQGGVSLYDDFRRLPPPTSTPEIKRATRWGYYGIVHRGPAAVLGEIGAGTDELSPAPGLATGPKQNSLAWWLEGDYAPWRQANFRARYDRMSLDRGAADPYIVDLNAHSRFAIEAEWVPVPFAELRWALRFIQHDASDFRDFFGAVVPIHDETQSFIQFHFSY
jgi:hypothetical protein